MHIIQDDPITTIPMAYSPEWYEKHQAAHAASEIHDYDDGVEFMGRLLVFAALLTAVVATIVVVML